MRSPTLSVLMPILDPDPEYLRLAIESVLAQSFTEFELIITEDPGKGEDAGAVVAGFRDQRIVHQVNSKRSRLIDQRNQGLRSARALLVALADADDISEPHRFERQLAFMAAHPEVAVLSSQLCIIDPAGRVLGWRRYPLTNDAIVDTLPLYNPIAQPAVMFRKKIVEAVGGYRYDRYTVNSDYDLWCRLAAAGSRFSVLDEALVQYRIHSGGLKTARLREVIQATIDIKLSHFREQLTTKARLRLALERLLLRLPPRLVLKLFMLTQYRTSWAQAQSRAGR